jgi:hypothetical protein
MRTPFRLMTPAALITGVLLAGVTPRTVADTLLVERVARQSTTALPARGQSMTAVRARFGEPTETLAAVGGDQPRQPPITRWIYPEFTVHFERDRVIHSVVRRSSKVEQGPKPVE